MPNALCAKCAIQHLAKTPAGDIHKLWDPNNVFPKQDPNGFWLQPTEFADSNEWLIAFAGEFGDVVSLVLPHWHYIMTLQRVPKSGRQSLKSKREVQRFWLLCKSRVFNPKVRTGVCRAYQPKPAKTQIWNETVSQFGAQNQKQFLKPSPSPETIFKITRLNSRKSPVPLEKTSVWNSLWI